MDNFGFDLADITTKRIVEKLKLFHAIEGEMVETSKNKNAYYKGYEPIKAKSLMKDVKKSLKIINKKNPLYVEMPKLVPQKTDGTYKQVYDGQKEEDAENIIHQPETPSKMVEYTEDMLIEDKKTSN